MDVARAVIFVGFSLGDLDIRRILFESEVLRQKCLYALGKSPDPSTLRRAGRFGLTLTLDTEGFAALLGRKAAAYAPPKEAAALEYCVRRFQIPSAAEPPRDPDVFDLLLWGRVDARFVWGSLHGGPRYSLERAGVKRALESFDSGKRVAVIHSDLGNGKTATLDLLKCRAVGAGFEVYTLAGRGESLFEELEAIARSPRKTLLVIEHYPDWHDALAFLGNHPSDNLFLVVSARTSAHDVAVDRLAEELRTGAIAEILVDRLDQAECEWVVDLFDEYGLWGDLAAKSRERKTNYLEEVCQGQWSAILLR